MKLIFQSGDTKTYEKTVESADIARFESGTVHEVYSTFSMARDAEWACRLFVLDMKEEHEEGIGTFVEVYHDRPAGVGSQLVFEARIDSIEGNAVVCSWKAFCGNHAVGHGRTGQKILPKEKIDKIFENL